MENLFRIEKFLKFTERDIQTCLAEASAVLQLGNFFIDTSLPIFPNFICFVLYITYVSPKMACCIYSILMFYQRRTLI